MTEGLQDKFHLCCPSLNSEAKSFERKQEQAVGTISKLFHGFRGQFWLLPMFRENKYLCEWSTTLGHVWNYFFFHSSAASCMREAEGKLWKQSDCWRNWSCGRALPLGSALLQGLDVWWAGPVQLHAVTHKFRRSGNENRLHGNHFSSPGRAGFRCPLWKMSVLGSQSWKINSILLAPSPWSSLFPVLLMLLGLFFGMIQCTWHCQEKTIQILFK